MSMRGRYVLWGAAITIAAGVVIAGLAVASGMYNVAASARHFYVTDRLIKLVLWRSVSTHSNEIATHPSKTEDVALGAHHFATGCAPCHGAPGRPRSPIVRGMYPAPPPLAEVVDDWEDDELAWIVFNGLKFTGMPQWAGRGRLDEVWPLVAFLRQLPAMSPERFAAYVDRRPAGGSASSAVAACSGCHGGEGVAPASEDVPPLQGQSQAYLARALDEYANDERQSGLMEPIAAALSPQERAAAAEAYAAMPPLSGDPSDPATTDVPSLGMTIATRGVAEQSIAACAACHEGRGSAQFPRLGGLKPRYIRTQLDLFRSGVRGNTAFGRIMQTVANRLDPDEMDAAAAYLGRQALGNGGETAPGRP